MKTDLVLKLKQNLFSKVIWSSTSKCYVIGTLTTIGHVIGLYHLFLQVQSKFTACFRIAMLYHILFWHTFFKCYVNKVCVFSTTFNLHFQADMVFKVEFVCELQNNEIDVCNNLMLSTP